MSRQFVWRSLLVLGVIAASIWVVLDRPMRLGLDLRGGTQIVLEAQDTELESVEGDTLDRTVEVLRRRVDQLGVSEPTLQASGDRRVIIELPGVTDPDEALEVIGKTAQLTFHPVKGTGGGKASPKGDEDSNDDLVVEDEQGGRLRLGPPALTGDAVGDAEGVVDTEAGGAWTVSISFRGDGGEDWAELTGAAACEPVGAPQRRAAIVLDEEVISSPEVSPEVECDVGITGGDTVITGNFTRETAQDLALLIRAGALPVPVEVIEQRTIGPSLGDAAVDASMQAALFGGALTILYVIFYYRLLGGLAALALFAYGLISYAVLVVLGATLTLPGIAGFVLAIGMAVDANVLVFERTKEEFAVGRSIRPAVRRGFEKAWSAIADSNATTVLAAIILFYFAIGAVRGFGVTLTVGVAVSMFSALVITRLLVELSVRVGAVARRPGLMGMNVGGRLRKRFAERPIDIMSRRRLWFVLSGVLVVVAAAGLVARGLDFGLEFTGGRLVEFSTAEEADLDKVRASLADAGFPRAIVQESGDGNVSVRAGELSATEETRVARAVSEVAGSAQVVRDEFIGPTIGDELRRKAVIALSLGLMAQLLYLAFRFRWTYGASAVVALFHDIMILLGIFAWLQKSIDGVFVAALLTVIGYSINDSVVVFDRIREQRKLRPKEPVADVVNDASLQTIPRTINTGLGALFILVALYLLGGETLTDFAFALIVGILVGTYSSVLTAAPAVVAFETMRPAGGRPTGSPAAKKTPAQRAAQAAAKAQSKEPSSPAPTSPPSPTSPKKKPPPRKRAGSAKRKRRRR